ncbi:hypothetical protein KP509_17G036200 [Ceratopteris richardii]|uniref:PPM-type phosphatase domain-containing protein n=1 Tax=Ceratopteris richardii TaxID=49495 RepID=A0A8T2SUA3_CERRI|nr:hypothetical protein KP509_17G036200 [Ceratopteris richardii]KAH7373082.1 hypothetical protein KP509_17G036200 [Ceratopteris richardii]
MKVKDFGYQFSRMNGQHFVSPERRVRSSEVKEPLESLSHLISRELQSERIPRPIIRFGYAAQPKKGEDFALINPECQRIPGDRFSAFAAFAVLDGHNGTVAASYAKDNLLKEVMNLIPSSLGHDEWLTFLPKAFIGGFLKANNDFQKRRQSSGTTVTFVVVDRWTVTVASVGDSHCILDSQGGAVSSLTVDHVSDHNEEENNKVTANGSEIGRFSLMDEFEVGSSIDRSTILGLSKNFGDMGPQKLAIPIPHVKQVKLSSSGGRLIIASDGVWDALTYERVAKCSRGLPAELAARQVVKEALKTRGLQDDTTCIVVDIMPPKFPTPLSPCKKQNWLKNFILGKQCWRSCSKPLENRPEPEIIEELYEQGSTFSVERVGAEDSAPTASELFQCVFCQKDLLHPEDIHVREGSLFSVSPSPWNGPLLCASCKELEDKDSIQK